MHTPALSWAHRVGSLLKLSITGQARAVVTPVTPAPPRALAPAPPPALAPPPLPRAPAKISATLPKPLQLPPSPPLPPPTHALLSLTMMRMGELLWEMLRGMLH
jgi:hypothetical protein